MEVLAKSSSFGTVSSVVDPISHGAKTSEVLAARGSSSSSHEVSTERVDGGISAVTRTSEDEVEEENWQESAVNTAQEGTGSPGSRAESSLKHGNSVPAQLVSRHSARGSQALLDPLEDVVVLYRTLVRDQAVPAGFEEAFSRLAPHISPSASRQQETGDDG